MISLPQCKTLSLAMTFAAGLAMASPALAAAAPKARLTSCRAGSCLLVSGRRDSATAVVLINDHAVAVSGQRHWEVGLALDEARRWSSPLAGWTSVATYDPQSQTRIEREASLPIGLLGHADLDTIVVALK